MVLEVHAELVATSRADELALRSLIDVVQVTANTEARIVGGHMAAIWLAARPVVGVIERRTTDSDTAITTELASSGQLHDRFIEMGYHDTSGNNYVRSVAGIGELSVDLLVPSNDSRFRKKTFGGRGFDAAPGLLTTLETPPVNARIGATLLDGSTTEFLARIPPLEIAVVLKAYAFASRHADKDVQDLYNMLEIAAHYSANDIGGWSLNSADRKGSRADAVQILTPLADSARNRTWPNIPSARFAALVYDLTAVR